MSSALQFYIITLIVYFSVNLIASWALNLQYGLTGVINFGFIAFQAAGAYAAAVVTLGPSAASGGFQEYIGGTTLPYPLPLLVGTVVAAALAGLVGLIALKPARRDYQALVFLVVSIIAITVVSAETGLLNGTAGLAAVPQPFADSLNLSLVGYGWFYVALSGAICGLVFLMIHRMTRSPWGRRLRAVRDQPAAAAAVGINVRSEEMKVLIIGGALAGLSGALLVQFIGAWAPAGWEYGETILYFAVIIIGGRANNAGVAVGVAVVWTGFQESVRFLPSFGSVGGLADALPKICVGLMILAFLWFRPQGLIPERRRKLAGVKPAQEPSAILDPSPSR